MQRSLTSQMAADVIVIGAGPAGQMAAIAAAEALAAGRAAGRRGARVVVIEQLKRAGAKLLATGGGRCNLTNTLEPREFLSRFARGGPGRGGGAAGRRGRPIRQEEFIRHAIQEFGSQELREFFRSLGVETVAEGPAVYPASHSAATVQQALTRRCGELGVELVTGERVTRLTVEASGERGAVRGVALASGREIRASRVIVATGGRSYRELGGTGGGYDLARQAGHEVVEPLPALVDLKTKERWPASCAGISVAAARVSIERGAAPGAAGGPSARRGAASRDAVTGDVLFTHEGLSGPAILDLSGDVMEWRRELSGDEHQTEKTGSAATGTAQTDRAVAARMSPAGAPRTTQTGASRAEVVIRVELLPGATGGEWRARIDRWRQSAGRRAVRALVAELLPARLASALCAEAGIGEDATAAHIGAAQRSALAELLAGVRLTVVGCGGFERAMVTRGGVSLKEVDGRTMASRRVKGLYFAGEVLDVDGPCGGFNLQWAFSSGRLAGLSASSEASERKEDKQG